MSIGMYPCPICGFECDSYKEAEECRKQHNLDEPKLCPKCSGLTEEHILANGSVNYYCENCKIKYSKEEIDNEIKRIREAKP